jgi:ketosteroid isomerase-like protein
MASHDATRHVIERALERARAYDADGYADVFADDAVLEFPFAPAGWPSRLQGRAAILAMLRLNFARARDAGRRFTDLRPLVHEGADPETAVVELDARVESPSTGKSCAVRYVHVYRVHEGRVVSLRDYFSPEQIAEVQALGGPPPKKQESVTASLPR